MCTTVVQAHEAEDQLRAMMDADSTPHQSFKDTHPPMLSVKQAEDVLNVSGRTITRMCEQGKIKAVKVNSLWRINRDALLAYAGLE